MATVKPSNTSKSTKAATTSQASKPSAAANKTQPTTASVDAYIASRANDAQRADCDALITLLQRVTQQKPTLWGPSIVGFGTYTYRYESGRTGESCLTGFAIRGRELVIYLVAEGTGQQGLLAKLGKHKIGKACLYIKCLADIDQGVLEQLVTASVDAARRRSVSTT